METGAASRVRNSHHGSNGKVRAGAQKDKISARSKSTSGSNSRQRQKQSSRTSAGTSRSLVDDEADDDDDNEDENVEEEDDDEDDDETDHNTTHSQTPPPSSSSASRASSPEPDYILAEVTTKNPTTTNPFSSSSHSSDPTIPPSLIHLILTHHFAHPDTTSLSTDARTLLGKYVEVFVREGIRRCVAQKDEHDGVGNGANDDNAFPASDKGWLEVEDLERIGVQLCLDF